MQQPRVMTCIGYTLQVYHANITFALKKTRGSSQNVSKVSFQNKVGIQSAFHCLCKSQLRSPLKQYCPRYSEHHPTWAGGSKIHCFLAFSSYVTTASMNSWRMVEVMVSRRSLSQLSTCPTHRQGLSKFTNSASLLHMARASLVGLLSAPSTNFSLAMLS